MPNDLTSRLSSILLLVALVCPGCLILDPPDFPDPENELPTILSTEPPSAEVRFVDRRESEDVEFRVLVFDGNEEDVLVARAFIDAAVDDASRGRTSVETAQGGDVRERIVTVDLQRGNFLRGCHVVEVDVIDDSSGWVSQREVASGVGKVTATWFVLAHDGDGYDDISLASCPGADPGVN